MVAYKTVNKEEFLAALESAKPSDLEVVRSGYAQKHSHLSMKRRVLVDHVLWYFDEGHLEGEVKGKAVTLKPRMFQWISSGVPHSFYSVGETQYSNFILRFRLMKKGVYLRLKEDRISFESSPEIRKGFDDICLTLKFKTPYGFLRFRTLLMLLMIDVFKVKDDVARAGRGVFSLGEIKRINEYLEENADRQVVPLELAKLFQLNPDYFSRKFRGQFGCPPRTWLRNEKIRRACSMLCETSQSIKQIADQLNFDDQLFFSRQFKKVTGMTPSEYRKSH
jgi:AraC family transcriptional regulator, arabinose operon regulatory protein